MSDSLWPNELAHQAPLSTGILQSRILEWVAMPSSKGSSIQGSNACLLWFLHCRWVLYRWATRETFLVHNFLKKIYGKQVSQMCLKASLVWGIKHQLSCIWTPKRMNRLISSSGHTTHLSKEKESHSHYVYLTHTHRQLTISL